ncbi:hypothetical protein [Streptomyces sp. TS71-3]|uniref:hypothetical protein n=1 Tax=Streptomyces sp. TS71-3 TaxID=2733862 RepID=UPI0035AC26A5
MNNGFSSTAKMSDRLVANSCLLGFSNLGTGLSGIPAVRPASSVSLAGLSVRERDERPTQAPEAVATAQAKAYAFAATGAGFRKLAAQHMWAFRGLEPWSDPA